MEKNTKVKALINLLDDPDTFVYEAVEKELEKENTEIIPVLEEMWENNLDEMCQQRIENLIQFLQFKQTKNEFGDWAQNAEADILEGFYIIDKFQYPDLNFDKLGRKLEQLRKDVWIELSESLTSLEKTTVLNHIFFDRYEFSINHTNLTSPQNCYLSQVVDTHKGNPVSIAILYSIIARMLDLPIYLIDFPKTPLLAYFDHEIATKAHGEDVDSDILFYINPSNKGSITGRRELEYHLNKMNHNLEPKYYERANDRTIILRLLELLKRDYKMVGQKQKTNEIAEFMALLTQNNIS